MAEVVRPRAEQLADGAALYNEIHALPVWHQIGLRAYPRSFAGSGVVLTEEEDSLEKDGPLEVLINVEKGRSSVLLCGDGRMFVSTIGGKLTEVEADLYDQTVVSIRTSVGEIKAAQARKVDDGKEEVRTSLAGFL